MPQTQMPIQALEITSIFQSRCEKLAGNTVEPVLASDEVAFPKGDTGTSEDTFSDPTFDSPACLGDAELEIPRPVHIKLGIRAY